MEARIAGFIAFDHYTREENKSLLGRKIYQRKFFGRPAITLSRINLCL